MDRYAPIAQLQTNRQRLRAMLRQDPQILTPPEQALRSCLMSSARDEVKRRADRMFKKIDSNGPIIVIKPAGDGCNYRCLYCFHPEDLPVVKPMALDTLERIYLGLQEVFGDTPRLIWHGGEPLLAGKQFYREAFDLQKKIFGRVIHNSIQTNGSLLDEEWVQFFKQAHVSIGFSLDGDLETNNRTRRNAGGKGGYAATVRGIRLVLNAGMRTGAITVVTHGRKDTPQSYYAAMRELGVTTINMNPATHPADLRPSLQEHTNFVREVIEIWLEDGGRGPRPRILDFYLPMLMGQYRRGGCVWAGSCVNIPEVQSDGRVKGLCDRNVDFSLFPKAIFGNLLTDSPQEVFKGERIQEFNRLTFQQPQSCQGCPLSWSCRGGCVHQRLDITGSLDQPDPFCAYYQDLYAYLQSVIDRVRDFPEAARDFQAFAEAEEVPACPGLSPEL
jgi:uncharacterized protein